MGDYLLYNNEWIQLDRHIFVKKINKTIFMHDRVGIPKTIATSFGIDNTKEDNKLDIRLQYNGDYFAGYIEVFSYHRSRMLWHSDFSSLLKQEIPTWERVVEQEYNSIYLRFEKKNNLYQVEIIDLNQLMLDFGDKEMYIIEDVFKPTQHELRYITQRDLNELIILYNGLDCQICGFNFKQTYGTDREEFIEISKINHKHTTNKVNFKKDYSVICSNCKSVIDHTSLTYDTLVQQFKTTE